eukprot:SAG31_NODE_22066_length_534_cov_1.645977_2_plen_36_part_01
MHAGTRQHNMVSERCVYKHTVVLSLIVLMQLGLLGH